MRAERTRTGRPISARLSLISILLELVANFELRFKLALSLNIWWGTRKTFWIKQWVGEKNEHRSMACDDDCLYEPDVRFGYWILISDVRKMKWCKHMSLESQVCKTTTFSPFNGKYGYWKIAGSGVKKNKQNWIWVHVEILRERRHFL